jgi:predicted CXXCH cytochrome family protein
MSQPSAARRACAILMSLLLLLPLAATADNDEGGEKEALPFSALSFPEPARHFSATQKCVQPDGEMRRNHMKYILHQRDETVHEGIRTRQYSLEECVNCHAAKNDEGEYIPVNDPDQFCYSCHSYAAVSIDCFQCHATKPVRPSTLETLSPGAGQGVQGMASGDTLKLLASEGQGK